VVESGPEIDPFDQGSAFARLAELHGIVLFYGAGINSATILHHGENLAGRPRYRYDRFFSGSVMNREGVGHVVRMRYHVRPRTHP
jgi:aminoglycoside N3'-acetyltransferase